MPHYYHAVGDQVIKTSLLVRCLAFMFPVENMDQLKLENPYSPGYWQESLLKEMYRSAHGHMMLNAFAQRFDATFVDRHLMVGRSMGRPCSLVVWDSLSEIRSSFLV